jgi:hypothetical protein
MANMTPQQLISIFIRLFSIWLFIMTLQVLGMASGLQKIGSPLPSIFPYCLALIPLMSGIILWYFPQGIALLLLPKQEQRSAAVITTQPIALTAAGIVLLGLYTIVYHFPAVAALVLGILLHIDQPDYQATLQMNGLVALTSIVLGFGLVSKAWSIAHLIFRSVRHAPSVD